MRRHTWISAVFLTLGLIATFGLLRVGPIESSHGSPTAAGGGSGERTPLRYALRMLRSAAEPFTYLPRMERAVAATLPTVLPDGSLLKDAEVTLTRMGPLLVGMTVEEGADALGLPLVPLGGNAGGECAYFQPNAKGAAVGLMVVDNRIIRIDVWPGSEVATGSGIKIGSTEADILAQYPDQIEATPNPYTGGKVMTLVPSEPGLDLYRLVFETDTSGRVVQYRTGQFPAVTWPDGCV